MSKSIKLRQRNEAAADGKRKIRLIWRSGSATQGHFKITLPHGGSNTPPPPPPPDDNGEEPGGSTDGTATFSLEAAASTSAGAYEAQSGKLVRTLWSGVRYQAGTYPLDWDGYDDNGVLLADGDYNVVVQSNNCTAEWEGVIANTSLNTSGYAVHKGVDFIAAIAVQGSRLYYGTGYSEGSSSQSAFDLNNAQVKITIGNVHDTNQSSYVLCSDNNLVYWAGSSYGGGSTYFVYATLQSDNSNYTFVNGTTYKLPIGFMSYNAISLMSGAITGMAAQQTGNYLFVCRGSNNSLYVHDKTGLLVQTLSFTACGSIAVDPSDNALWLEYSPAGSPVCEKFTINADGTLTSTGLQVSSIGSIGAIAVNSSTLLIADVSVASQQVKAFSTTTGTAQWILGQAGGYSTSPQVADDKFFFSYATADANSYNQVYHALAFQPGGSFWVLDNPNCRLLHFSAARQLIETVGYVPRFYSHSVDLNNPSRVTLDYKEYSIDYTKPLAQGWKLINNWSYYAPTITSSPGRMAMPSRYVTLSNGRAYMNVSVNNVGKIYEMTASGLRDTGAVLTGSLLLLKDGSYMVQGITSSICTIKTYPLTGFDSNNNPVWSTTANVLGDTGIITNDDTSPNVLGRNQGVITDSGNIIFMDTFPITGANNVTGVQDGPHRGYHLGAVKLGTSGYLWQTARATYTNYAGPMPADGTFDVGNGVNAYAGSCVLVDSNDLIWGYHGEFWKQAQANIWNQVSDIGLFVQQFGYAQPRGVIDSQPPAIPMMAGNSYAASLVRTGGFLYLYHNDESYHGGLHRWKVSGLDTIKKTTIAVTIQTVQQGLEAVYFDCPNHNSVYYRKNRQEVAPLNVAWGQTMPTDTALTSLNYSVRWTGFIKAQYSEVYTLYVATAGGIRVWINKTLIIDQLTNTVAGEYSGTVSMKAGSYYAIKVEYSNVATNNAQVQLSWSSPSQPKQVIPIERLFPDVLPQIPNLPAQGIDLLADLPFNAELTSGYGWTRVGSMSTGSHNTWRVRTNLYKYPSNDIQVDYEVPSQNFEVRKDLGALSGLSYWKLELRMTLGVTYDNNNSTNKLYLEVLDIQSKVLVQLQWILPTISNVSYRQLKGNSAVLYSIQNGTTVADPTILLTLTYQNGVLKAQVNGGAEQVLSPLDAAAIAGSLGFLRFNAVNPASTTYPKTFYLAGATLYY